MPTTKPDLTRLSQSQLSEASGRSREFIRKRLAQARIEPVSQDGRTKWYAAPAALEAILAGGRADLDLSEERARLAKAQTRAQDLKNAETEGELLWRSEVVETWTTQIVAVKNKIRGISKRAPARIPGFTKAMAAPLLGMIDEVLRDLAGDGLPEERVAREKTR